MNGTLSFFSYVALTSCSSKSVVQRLPQTGNSLKYCQTDPKIQDDVANLVIICLNYDMVEINRILLPPDYYLLYYLQNKWSTAFGWLIDIMLIHHRDILYQQGFLKFNWRFYKVVSKSKKLPNRGGDGAGWLQFSKCRSLGWSNWGERNFNDWT